MKVTRQVHLFHGWFQHIHLGKVRDTFRVDNTVLSNFGHGVVILEELLDNSKRQLLGRGSGSLVKMHCAMKINEKTNVRKGGEVFQNTKEYSALPSGC